MSDDRIISSIKDESRTIQQRVSSLESKVSDMMSHHESLNKLNEIEEKLSRIESMLNEKLTHVSGCTDDLKGNVERLRSELAAMQSKPSNTPEF